MLSITMITKQMFTIVTRVHVHEQLGHWLSGLSIGCKQHEPSTFDYYGFGIYNVHNQCTWCMCELNEQMMKDKPVHCTLL